jgi:hypothetical protein
MCGYHSTPVLLSRRTEMISDVTPHPNCHPGFDSNVWIFAPHFVRCRHNFILIWMSLCSVSAGTCISFQKHMTERRTQPTKFTVIAAQCVNWWLGYVLAQPVIIDVPAFLHFMKTYFGVETVSYFCRTSCELMIIRIRQQRAQTMDEVW